MNSYKNKIAAKMRTAQKIVNRTQKLTDVRQGGLVLGDSHDDGGIIIWVQDGDDLVMKGEMEGLEFIMSEAATITFRNRLDEIAGYSGETKNLTLSEKTDCLYYLIDSGDAVLAGNQYIISKAATSVYLAELCKLNEEAARLQQPV